MATLQAVDSELATGQSSRTWGLSEPQSLFQKPEGAGGCQPPGEGQQCGACKCASPQKATIGNPGIGAGAWESGEMGAGENAVSETDRDLSEVSQHWWDLG